MEHKIILNLLNESSDSKFVTRKWNNANNQSDTNYDAANEIIYNTEVLQSNFYDYNDAYVSERGDITIIGHNLATEIAFKNCIPFAKCITKIDQTAI